MASAPPRAGPTKVPSKPTKHQQIPDEWLIELPQNGATADSEFGGCRSIEAGYRTGPVLGQGTYGEVYLATDLATGEHVAAKKIKMDNEKEGFPITAIREIKILSALASAEDKLGDTLLRNNVIGLREIVRSASHRSNNYRGSIYMMFDYMDHDMTGLLERSQREHRRFTPAQLKCYLRQLFCGLALLATRDILHRDLKNANLLVNNKGELKIADFGLARYFHKRGEESADNSRMTNRVITLWYRPPELFLGSDRYGTEIDMWSAGCIMFELITGRPLFPGKDEGDQVAKIFSIMGAPTEATMPGCTKYQYYDTLLGNGRASQYPSHSKLRQHCISKGVNDKHALDLLENLLALNPAARISADKAATHSYFFTEPLPARLSEMPKFESSHEMTMKKARQRPQPQQPQPPGGRAAPPYMRQREQGPPAQKQKTQGQYGGPQPGYPGGYHPSGGGGGGHHQMPPPGQQPYHGGGRGGGGGRGAPAAGMAGMAGPGGVGGSGRGGGMMQAPIILNPAQAQQLAQQGLLAAPQMAGGMAAGMMAAPGMMQQQAAAGPLSAGPGGGGYGGGGSYAGGPQGSRGAGGMGGGAYGGHTAGGSHGGQMPTWQRDRR